MRKAVWLIGPRDWCPTLEGQALPDQVLFIDGGLLHKEKLPASLLSEVKSLSLGDGDSLREHGVKERESLDIKFPEDKDQSDFALALCHLLGNESLDEANTAETYEFSLFGLTGGRRDHEMAILGEIHQFLKEQKNCRFNFYDAQNRMTLTIVNHREDFNYRGTFSVFAIKETTVSIKGEVKYPAENLKLKPFQSLGLSNEAKGSFSVNSPEPILIYWV